MVVRLRQVQLLIWTIVLLLLLSWNGSTTLFLFSRANLTANHDDKFCLLAFVPFTKNGTDIPFSDHDTSGGEHANAGFNHMAAAVLAVEHFNNRDGSVVSELSTNPLLQKDKCTLQIDFNTSRVFDSQVIGQHAVREMQNYLLQEGQRCPIAGPFSDYVSKELSVLASSIENPIVLYRATSLELAINIFSPYTTQTNSLALDNVEYLYDYLQYKGRDNYAAILFELESADAAQQTEGIARFLQGGGYQVVSQGFLIQNHDGIQDDLYVQNNALAALSNIKSKGNFRTIIVVLDSVNIATTIPQVAEAADRMQMNTGDHFWLFFQCIFSTALYSVQLQQNEQIVKLLQGAAIMDNVDGFIVDGPKDRFYQSWKQQGKDTVDILNQLNPVSEGQPGYYFAPDDYFQTKAPVQFAGYLYDAVMSIGIGACIAAQKANQSDGIISGTDHLAGIQASNFTGATGRVWYSKSSFFQGNGVRNSTASLYGVFNVFPDGVGDDKPVWVLTDLRDPLNSSVTVASNTTRIWDQRLESYRYAWTTIKDFVYRNGSTSPPYLLRDPPESNYLSNSARIFGLTLFAVIATLIVGITIWIVVHRNHKVLLAAQPHFLLPICLGSLLIAVCIVLISFDESYGVSQETLSRLCVAIPWCAVLGSVIISSSIFGKLWRVHKTLQFIRRKVPIWQVAVPVILLFIGSVLLLALWTALGDFGWVRTEINPITGESFGQCDANDGVTSWYWLLSIFLVGSLPEVLVLIMAYKTRDVADAYAESSWIFIMALVEFQTLLVGFPLVFVLRDFSSTGRYIGLTLLFAMFSTSSLFLIMGPKMKAFYFGVSTGRKRGERGGVHVSGVNSNGLPNSMSSAANAVATASAQNGRGSNTNDDLLSRLSGAGSNMQSTASNPRVESQSHRPESILEGEENDAE